MDIKNSYAQPRFKVLISAKVVIPCSLLKVSDVSEVLVAFTNRAMISELEVISEILVSCYETARHNKTDGRSLQQVRTLFFIRLVAI